MLGSSVIGHGFYTKTHQFSRMISVYIVEIHLPNSNESGLTPENQQGKSEGRGDHEE